MFGIEQGMELTLKYHDEASSVLESVSGNLTSQMDVLEKFAGKYVIVNRAMGAAMTRMAAQYAQMIKDTRELAQQNNLTTQSVQKYKYMMDAMNQPLNKYLDLRKRIYEAGLKSNTVEGQIQLQRLRIIGAIKDQNDATKNTDAVMQRVALAYKEAQKDGRGYELVMRLFGEGTEYLIPLLEKMATEMDSASKNAEKNISPITEEDKKTADELNKSIVEVRTSIEQFAQEIFREVAPALKWFVAGMKEALEYARYMWEMFIGPLVKAFLDVGARIFWLINHIKNLTKAWFDIVYAVVLAVMWMGQANKTLMVLGMILGVVHGNILTNIISFIMFAAWIGKAIFHCKWFGMALEMLGIKAAIAKIGLGGVIAGTIALVAMLALFAYAESDFSDGTAEMAKGLDSVGASADGANGKMGAFLDKMKSMQGEDFFGNIIAQIANLPDQVIPPLMEMMKRADQSIGMTVRDVISGTANQFMGGVGGGGGAGWGGGQKGGDPSGVNVGYYGRNGGQSGGGNTYAKVTNIYNQTTGLNVTTISPVKDIRGIF